MFTLGVCKMCTRSIVYITMLMIIRSFGEYINNDKKCISISQDDNGKLQCRENKTVYIEQIWLDTNHTCGYYRSTASLSFKNESQITCSNKSQCVVTYYRHYGYATYKYMNIRFQCKECLPIYSGTPTIITCPANSVVQIDDIWYNDVECPAFVSDSSNRNVSYYRNMCGNSFQCIIPNIEAHKKRASIYYYCKGGILVDDRSTKSHVKLRVRTSHLHILDDPNYAAIVGGIVGVLLVICIIVGGFLLRKCNCSESGNAQKPSTETVTTKPNPTYDPTHGQTEPDNNQQTHLLNSPDAIHISTSHAANVDNTVNEESNTYSHLRNIVDDSDVMYDHTIRHNVHETCDGDYGITHKRITEDDYDMSGNYRQSFSNKADPVYN